MIRFTASGWRGVISDDFTFRNVRRVAHVLSIYVKENPEFGVGSAEYLASRGGAKAPAPVVVIGYDARFLAEEFAHEAAGVLASDGVKTLISQSDLPVPAVGCAVRRHGAVGGLMITGSRRPAQYGGLKWTPFWGGAAPTSIMGDVERRLELMGHQPIKTMALDRSLRESWIVNMDFREEYARQLLGLIDASAIKKARLKVGLDVMHGSARLHLRPLLEKLGVQVVPLHEDRDVLFGGKAPDPTPESLAELSQVVKKQRLHIGLACDGDGHRFGIIDADGSWFSPNDVLGVLFDHLAGRRGLKGKAVRSVVTSHFIDAVARSRSLETRETPMGFNYVGEQLRTGQVLVGGEESGGLSIQGHIPDRDGLLACLLMLEIAAVERVPLSQLRDRLFKKVGSFHHRWVDHSLERSRQAMEIEDRLKVRPPLDLAGGAVWRIDQADGFKFILRDGSWLCVRPQPPGPAFRLYAEASDLKKVEALLAEGRKLLQGKF